MGDDLNNKTLREQNACAVENNYREEMGLDQRETYYFTENTYVSVPHWDDSTDGWSLYDQSWDFYQ